MKKYFTAFVNGDGRVDPSIDVTYMVAVSPNDPNDPINELYVEAPRVAGDEHNTMKAIRAEFERQAAKLGVMPEQLI